MIPVQLHNLSLLFWMHTFFFKELTSVPSFAASQMISEDCSYKITDSLQLVTA